jgi:hypothetical protein
MGDDVGRVDEWVGGVEREGAQENSSHTRKIKEK